MHLRTTKRRVKKEIKKIKAFYAICIRIFQWTKRSLTQRLKEFHNKQNEIKLVTKFFIIQHTKSSPINKIFSPLPTLITNYFPLPFHPHIIKYLSHLQPSHAQFIINNKYPYKQIPIQHNSQGEVSIDDNIAVSDNIGVARTDSVLEPTDNVVLAEDSVGDRESVVEDGGGDGGRFGLGDGGWDGLGLIGLEGESGLDWLEWFGLGEDRERFGGSWKLCGNEDGLLDGGSALDSLYWKDLRDFCVVNRLDCGFDRLDCCRSYRFLEAFNHFHAWSHFHRRNLFSDILFDRHHILIRQVNLRFLRLFCRNKLNQSHRLQFRLNKVFSKTQSSRLQILLLDGRSYRLQTHRLQLLYSLNRLDSRRQSRFHCPCLTELFWCSLRPFNPCVRSQFVNTSYHISRNLIVDF